MRPVKNMTRTFIVCDREDVHPMGRKALVTICNIQDGTVYYTYPHGDSSDQFAKTEEFFYQSTEEVK